MARPGTTPSGDHSQSAGAPRPCPCSATRRTHTGAEADKSLRNRPARDCPPDWCAGARHFPAMLLTILRLLSLIPTALRLRSELALENLALRQQLAVLNRRYPRPKLRKSDRLFWLLLSRSWGRWKETLVIVKPETVLRWHRKRFGSFLS